MKFVSLSHETPVSLVIYLIISKNHPYHDSSRQSCLTSEQKCQFHVCLRF